MRRRVIPGRTRVWTTADVFALSSASAAGGEVRLTTPRPPELTRSLLRSPGPAVPFRTMLPRQTDGRPAFVVQVSWSQLSSPVPPARVVRQTS